MIKQQVTIVDLSPILKEVSIEIAADEVGAEFTRTYDAYARYAKVPGFRQGKVPLAMVKQRFAKDIKEEVIGRLLPHAVEHALHDHKLRVVGDPRINPDEIKIKDGEPLQFKVTVDVFADFELQDYKGLTGTKRVKVVTDEDIDATINRWRESAAEFVPVEDRPAQTGDFVSVNLVGKYVNPEGAAEEEDLKADGVELELGAEGVQPEFNENLTGVKENDAREFRVVYPADFTSQGLAGKTIDFTATVTAVRQKELPAIDDELAKQFGDYESVQQMRDKLREDMVSASEREADFQLRDQLVDSLLVNYDFPVPEILIEQQAEDRLRRFAMQMMYSGLPPEYAKTINWAERRTEARISAVKDVRAALVMGRVAETEKVAVTEAEIDAEIAKLAAEQNASPEALKANLTKEDGISSIESRLRYSKAVDAVVSYANVSVETVTAEQLEKEAEEKRAAALQAQAAALSADATPASEEA